MEAMLTMRPKLFFRRCGTTARQQRNGPVRLMLRTRCHSAGSVSQTLALAPAIPALLTRMSILLNALAVASVAFVTDSIDVTSTWNDLTLPLGCNSFSACARAV